MEQHHFEDAAQTFADLESTLVAPGSEHKDVYVTAAHALGMYAQFPAGLRKLVISGEITESHVAAGHQINEATKQFREAMNVNDYKQLKIICEVAAKLCEQGYRLDEK